MTERRPRRVFTSVTIARLLPASVAAGTLLLAGCSGLGLNRQAPDEFLVIETNPLTLPPDMGTLAQPQTANTSEPATNRARDSAESILLGDATGEKAAAQMSDADAALLNSAGADKADGNIRALLRAEEAARRAEKEANKGLLDDLLPWQQDEGPDEPIIDPMEEMKQRPGPPDPQDGAEQSQ